jgi:hypothetical protein
MSHNNVTRHTFLASKEAGISARFHHGILLTLYLTLWTCQSMTAVNENRLENQISAVNRVVQFVFLGARV